MFGDFSGASKNIFRSHCIKCVQIWSFFWSVFRNEYGKIRTRKNSVFGHFLPNEYVTEYTFERLVIKHFASEDCDIVLAHFQDDARFRNDTLIAFYFSFPSCL